MRLLLLLAVTLTAQTPSFEVASIHPSKSLVTPSGLCRNLKPSTESVVVSEVKRLSDLVHDAYEDQVDGFDLPVWTSSSGASPSV